MGDRVRNEKRTEIGVDSEKSSKNVAQSEVEKQETAEKGLWIGKK